MDDGIGVAMRHDLRYSLKVFTPYMICVACYFGFSTLPSFTQQRVIPILFVNIAMSTITFNLMLSNMTGKPFKTIQPILFVLFVPLIAYHLCGCSAEVEA